LGNVLLIKKRSEIKEKGKGKSFIPRPERNEHFHLGRGGRVAKGRRGGGENPAEKKDTQKKV